MPAQTPQPPPVENTDFKDHKAKNKSKKKKDSKRKKSESSVSSSSSSDSSDDDKKKKKKKKKDRSKDYEGVNNKDLKMILLEKQVETIEKKALEDKHRALEREIDHLKSTKVPDHHTPIVINNNNNNNNGYQPTPVPIITKVINTIVYVKPDKDSQIICTTNVLSCCFAFFSLIYLFCVWPQVTNKKNVLIYSNIMNAIVILLIIILPSSTASRKLL